jgi:SanA protein
MRNIDAICFAAQYPEGYLKVRIRELLARPLMLWNELLKTPPQSLEDVPSK